MSISPNNPFASPRPAAGAHAPGHLEFRPNWSNTILFLVLGVVFCSVWVLLYFGGPPGSGSLKGKYYAALYLGPFLALGMLSVGLYLAFVRPLVMIIDDTGLRYRVKGQYRFMPWPLVERAVSHQIKGKPNRLELVARTIPPEHAQSARAQVTGHIEPGATLVDSGERWFLVNSMVVIDVALAAREIERRLGAMGGDVALERKEYKKATELPGK